MVWIIIILIILIPLLGILTYKKGIFFTFNQPCKFIQVNVGAYLDTKLAAEERLQTALKTEKNYEKLYTLRKATVSMVVFLLL